MKISGWGRYPCIKATGHSFEKPSQLVNLLKMPVDYIPHGMGRSYGDSALNERVIFSHRFNKILEFNPQDGIVKCESGVMLAELIDVFLPKGWFLSITPGTKFVTVGGAIASDVHGKNHHSAGCFSECVISFELMLPNGDIVSCSREDNYEFFLATCGGIGLTGFILTATLRLKPVKSAFIHEAIIRCHSLEEIFPLFEKHKSATYSVAWIDCLAQSSKLGRSILMLGEHANTESLNYPKAKMHSIPFDFPNFFLNKYTVFLFNKYFYQANPSLAENRLVSIETFFYPLDKIGHWNRMYGHQGFTQYQLVLPKESSFRGLQAILKKTSSSGLGSFLTVLKLFGPQNENYLSFPLEGYTLALDFKIQKKLFPILDELDHIVLDHGGRIYLTKDVRMKREVFTKGYPKWNKFVKFRERKGVKDKFNSLQSRRLGI